MSNKPKITKADMNKILNCQDQLQSTLAGLVKATKSFQDASDKVEKEAAGFPITKRGSDYYQRIQDKKALNAANITIDKITKDYTADISAIKKNIGILKSQEIYQKRIKDLVKYYKQNISSDQKQIADEKSKRAIANRMSTFYNDKSETSKTVKKYTSYLYWGIFIISLIFLIYNGITGGFTLASISGLFTSFVNSTEESTEEPKPKVKTVNNPLSQKQEKQITGDPPSMSKKSKNEALATGIQVGGNNCSLHPWLGIVLVFALLPFTIEYIFKPLQPYFIELTLPRIGN
jgi:hypothetical protein